MRLARFRLERYGPFERLELAFDPTPGRINLVVAPNGYGKSVIRQAIGEFLFGIETRTPMAFRFGTERMRLLADVVTGDEGTPGLSGHGMAGNFPGAGTEVQGAGVMVLDAPAAGGGLDWKVQSLVRRKGNGITLAHADGSEVRPEETRRLLGGADETIFRELFGLDTVLLRSGGDDLIRSQGRLGQVLFAAGGGMARVRELLMDLERKRDELGKASARHKSRPLWSAFSNWQKGAFDLRQAAMRQDGWQALEREAAATAQRLETLTREQAEAARERERLHIVRACRPWLDRLAAARTVLAEFQDVPEVDDGFETRWREALQQGVVSAGNAEAATADLRTARENRAGLTFDGAWIAAETEIGELADLRGVAAECEVDLPTLQLELAAEQAKATALRRDLGWDATIPLPPVPSVREAQRRLRLRPTLAAEATGAESALAHAEQGLAATLAELAALPDQTDVAAVADLVGLLRAGGDPAGRLDTARRKLREAEAALRAALAAIPDCPLAEDTLITTAAPSEAKLDAAGNALNRAEAAQMQAVRALADLMDEIARQQAKLAALERTAKLPAPDALAHARARRDALWTGFCGLDRPDKAAAIELDRAMREADGIADALITHGREAAEAAALRGHLAGMEAERTRQVEAVAQAGCAVAHAKGVLLAMARTAGGEADDITGLRGFLRARQEAVACRAARDAAARELADLDAVMGGLAERLAVVMQAGVSAVGELGALLASADRRIEADRNLAAQRKSLSGQAAKQRAAQATAAIAAQKAVRGLLDWDAAWRPLAAQLARPEVEPPAATGDALAQIEDLRKAESVMAEKRARIDKMLAAVARLGAKVARLASLSPDLAALPPIEAAEAFRQRLQAEHGEAARCKDADRRVREAEAKLALAIEAAAGAARTLDGLRAALRVASNEAAELQLQRTRKVAAMRQDSAEAQRELAVQGGGLSLDVLATRAGETTADADAARIAEIDSVQPQRGKLIEEARVAAAAAAVALDQAGNGLDAAEAAQRREAAQAMLARTAEEALVLHAAHSLLQAALDRQASAAGQPLLTRIGSVFRTITGGAQAGVRVEDTKDGATMVALESDGLTRKSLEQLSEGTRDQLYLALRIAALEDYATTTCPLPFIADDILQTFDDPRTIATMRALLELSRRVQVIVLTHHPHVEVLAGALPEGAVRVIQLQD